MSAKLLVHFIPQFASQTLYSRLCPWSSSDVMCMLKSTLLTATRGPTGCLIRPLITFLKYKNSLKNVEQFRPLRVPRTVVVTGSAHIYTDNNDRGPVPRKVGHPRYRIIYGTARFESRHGNNLAYVLIVFLSSSRHMFISYVDWATTASFQFSILV